MERKNHPNEPSPQNETVYWSELAARAVDDDSAFTELYQHFFPRVYHFLLSKTKDANMADELVSRTFFKMYQNLGAYDADKGAFSTWLFTIARNEHLLYLRCADKIDPGEIEEDRLVAPEFEMPEVQTLKKEQAELLKAAIKQLPERDQRILVMTYWLNMKSEAIAAELGMTAGSVRTGLTRARASLKKILEKDMDHLD